MSKTKDNTKIEQSLIFMILLTFSGGFINAYTFFVRGGVFVSMHTGNMAKAGIAMYEKNIADFLGAIIPIIGCTIGAIIYQLVKAKIKHKSVYFQNQVSLWVELIALFSVAFIPVGMFNEAIAFYLAIATGYQLSTFRHYEGAVHNTTICTGNIRSLGQHIGDCIVNRDSETIISTAKYFILLFSFTFGTFTAGLLSIPLGGYGILVICAILLYLSFMLKKSNY